MASKVLEESESGAEGAKNTKMAPEAPKIKKNDAEGAKNKKMAPQAQKTRILVGPLPEFHGIPWNFSEFLDTPWNS